MAGLAGRIVPSDPAAKLGVMTQRILLVGDDARLAGMVSEYLAGAGFRVAVAGGGEAGIERLAREPFDAIVLDLMLPDMDGLEVCRRVRAKDDIPILMLTARARASAPPSAAQAARAARRAWAGSRRRPAPGRPRGRSRRRGR